MDQHQRLSFDETMTICSPLCRSIQCQWTNHSDLYAGRLHRGCMHEQPVLGQRLRLSDWLAAICHGRYDESFNHSLRGPLTDGHALLCGHPSVNLWLRCSFRGKYRDHEAAVDSSLIRLCPRRPKSV